jgi:myb proto-oncogene protein
MRAPNEKIMSETMDRDCGSCRQYKGKWTVEDDRKLLDAVVLEHGSNSSWARVASMLVPGRTNLQCRQKWAETFDPNMTTGKWTAEEDAKLSDAINVHGNDWVQVAVLFRGRSNTQVSSKMDHASSSRT